MPITDSFVPNELPELKRKLIATNHKPDQEEYICNQVQHHLGIQVSLAYAQAIDDMMDINLTASQCVIFLIKGEFSVGSPAGKDTGSMSKNTEWTGYKVEHESSVRLQPNTAVVIIDI